MLLLFRERVVKPSKRSFLLSRLQPPPPLAVTEPLFYVTAHTNIHYLGSTNGRSRTTRMCLQTLGGKQHRGGRGLRVLTDWVLPTSGGTHSCPQGPPATKAWSDSAPLCRSAHQVRTEVSAANVPSCTLDEGTFLFPVCVWGNSPARTCPAAIRHACGRAALCRQTPHGCRVASAAVLALPV